MVELLVIEPNRIGGYQEVGSVSPPFQEPAKVLAAQFVTLVIVQLRPLPVLVADQRQTGIGHYPEPFVLELEAVVDIQVPVEAETFSHQADVVDLFPPEGHAIGLHGIGISVFHFLMEMLHVWSAETPGAKDANGGIT